MKVLHMDALAACITLPPEAKTIWTSVNVVMTLGEDLPQAIQQSLFLMCVKENYFMLLSVGISIASSLRAMHEAMNRALAAAGVTDKENIQQCIVVSGAGHDPVNGRYYRSDYLSGGREVWIKQDNTNYRIQWSSSTDQWILDDILGSAPYRVDRKRQDQTVPIDAEWTIYQVNAPPNPTLTLLTE